MMKNHVSKITVLTLTSFLVGFFLTGGIAYQVFELQVFYALLSGVASGVLLTFIFSLVQARILLREFENSMKRREAEFQERIQLMEGEGAKLSSVLDHMSEGVVAVDGDCQVVLVNPAAVRIFEMEGPVNGKSLVEITRDEKIDRMMKQALREGRLVSEELEPIYPEGKTLKAQAMSVSPEKTHVRGVLVLSDITEIRKLELLRREFVANVSHELRTPLTSIKGFVETLLGGAYRSPEQSQSFLKMMDQDASRLTRLIDDLLELSKIESRRMTLQCEAFDLRHEIDKTISLCEKITQQKGVTLENQLSPDLDWKVWADRDKVRQILINLLDNAVKFNHNQSWNKSNGIRLPAVEEPATGDD